MIRKIFIIVALLLWTSGLAAAGKKRVLVLPFINIEKNTNVQYLETSLTDAVKENLRKLFAFDETPEKQWTEVSLKNYIYRDDYSTKTAAMNLGLLAKQDVVISGGFWIKIKGDITIFSRIRILDIAKKEVVTEFMETGPADSRIFDTVDRIAARISKEAKAILPTKEEWQRSGIKEERPRLPIFSDFLLSIQAGGGLYAMDYSDRIEAQQPALGADLSANMPFFSKHLRLGFQFLNIKESPVKSENPDIENLNIESNNNILNGYLGLGFDLGFLSLVTRLGGGYLLQSITVTGDRNESLKSSLPFANAGLSLGYSLNRSLELILAYDSIFEFEGGNITMLGLARLGVQFRL